MLRIPIVGGPCGGKSTIKGTLIPMLESRLGMKVFWVPESATECILNGIAPGEDISVIDFQELVLDKQLAKEALYEKAASFYNPDKTIIFYDRGIMDAQAYVGKDMFEEILRQRGILVSDVFGRYDAVLHLVSAADGAEEFYEWNDPNSEEEGNNAARSEPPELARKMDLETRNAWTGHPHLRIFDNTVTFEEKVNNVIKEVFSLLGEPEPMEIEKKFLIKKPTEDELERLGYVSKTNIIQTYLKDRDETERRVRQRGTKKDGYSFFYTEKEDVKTGKGMERIERERKISPKEYINYLSEVDTSLHQISKVRYCFVYASRYFELDVYPFSDDYAILEVELNSTEEKMELPNLKILKEVTGDKRYRNHALAKSMMLGT